MYNMALLKKKRKRAQNGAELHKCDFEMQNSAI